MITIMVISDPILIRQCDIWLVTQDGQMGILKFSGVLIISVESPGSKVKVSNEHKLFRCF